VFWPGQEIYFAFTFKVPDPAHPFAMNAASPEGTPQRRIGDGIFESVSWPT